MHGRLTGKGRMEDYSELGGTKLQGLLIFYLFYLPTVPFLLL